MTTFGLCPSIKFVQNTFTFVLLLKRLLVLRVKGPGVEELTVSHVVSLVDVPATPVVSEP